MSIPLFPFVTKALYMALYGGTTLKLFDSAINVGNSCYSYVMLLSSFLEVIALLMENYFYGINLISFLLLSCECDSVGVSVKLFLIKSFISLCFRFWISILGGYDTTVGNSYGAH